MDEPSKKSLCSYRTAQRGANVVGIIQIAIHTIGVVCTILNLAGVFHFEPQQVKPTADDLPPLDDTQSDIWMTTFTVLTLAFLGAGILGGAFLILGTNQRNGSYLNTWIFFAAFSTIWTISRTISGEFDWTISIPILIFLVILYAVGLCFVRVLKREFWNGEFILTSSYNFGVSEDAQA